MNIVSAIFIQKYEWMETTIGVVYRSRRIGVKYLFKESIIEDYNCELLIRYAYICDNFYYLRTIQLFSCRQLLVL